MRGTFVFPADDRGFMQWMEVRGSNGAVETVETVYIVTGSTYFVPEELFACDDPSLYETADPDYVDVDDRAMAEHIQEAYEDRPGPRMILRVHTHPGFPAQPSDQDYSVAGHREQLFDQYFDDYELFLGIHAIEAECTPDPEWMRAPAKTDHNKVSWWGENRKHTLAVFDGMYNPAPVETRSMADVLQPQHQQHGQQRQHGGPGPQEEIWDRD